VLDGSVRGLSPAGWFLESKSRPLTIYSFFPQTEQRTSESAQRSATVIRRIGGYLILNRLGCRGFSACPSPGRLVDNSGWFASAICKSFSSAHFTVNWDICYFIHASSRIGNAALLSECPKPIVGIVGIAGWADCRRAACGRLPLAISVACPSF
jgi:hypothetical protein